MSSQTGVFFFDHRPVREAVRDELHRALGSSDTDARGDYEAPGLFMAHAATWLDDVAETETQPHVSHARNTITFDGRLDNREDLLLRLGRSLNGLKTDPALALAAYEAWNIAGLVHLLGDWSMAVWEPATRSVILASDCASGRPLYYQANQERVLWSSYLKPLISLSGGSEIDEQFIAGFLTSNGAPNRTPYRGILSVPGGHSIRFSEHGASVRGFWDLPVHNRIRYENERDYDEHLRSLFRGAVRARLRTTYPVCSDLSGGLDSSSVVCMAQQLISSRQTVAPSLISVSYGPPGASDEGFYTTVQRFTGIESVYVNTDDFPFLSLDHLGDAAPAPWGALSDELARQSKQRGARAYLTGRGGDLMMGNWVDDSEQLAARLRRGQLKEALVEAVEWSKATRIPAPALIWRGCLASLPARWNTSKYEFHASIMRERYGDSMTQGFRSRTGLTEPDWNWSQRWKEAPPERRKHFKAVSRTLESAFFRPPERLQHLYYTHPCTHRPLVEFLLAIPASVLCSPNEPRRLMRRAFAELLPPQVLRRRSKASFTGVFLQSVRPVASALLADRSPLLVVERGYVDRREFRERLERVRESLDCNEPQLRQIVLLEIWLRRQEEQDTRLPIACAPVAAAASF